MIIGLVDLATLVGEVGEVEVGGHSEVGGEVGSKEGGEVGGLTFLLFCLFFVHMDRFFALAASVFESLPSRLSTAQVLLQEVQDLFSYVGPKII